MQRRRSAGYAVRVATHTRELDNRGDWPTQRTGYWPTRVYEPRRRQPDATAVAREHTTLLGTETGNRNKSAGRVCLRAAV